MLLSSKINHNEVIFGYLNGDDLNTNFNQTPSRYIINFFDWNLDFCKEQFPDILQIVEQRVKPERDNNNRKTRRENWWKYGEQASGLYRNIEGKKRILATSLTTKFHCFSFVSSSFVYSQNLAILSLDTYSFFSLIQSSLHGEWAWKFSATMGSSTLSYTPSTSFETFPFPQNITSAQEAKLEQIGEAYHEHRRQLMLGMQLGLTKTYNAFHCKEINRDNETWAALLEELDNGKELSEIKLKTYYFEKESVNLIRHFLKGEATISLRDAVEGIEKLRTLHVEMDEAVLDAYGWSENSNAISEKPIKLRHGFYEVDYLPENDRVRFTIHPEARKEVLKRLLLLNHKLYKEEVEAGLWDKKKSAKPKKYKTNIKSNKLNEPEEGYGGLFD